MKILVVTPFDETEWNWFGYKFGDGSFIWKFRNLSLFGKKPWIWFLRSFNTAIESNKHDIVISHHPYMTFYLALAMKLLGIKKPHYAFSFNHGNGRFFRGLMKKIAIQLFKDIQGFVIFSEYEKSIYGDYYKIPNEKFSFVHWAVNPPDIQGELPHYLNLHRSYICCMGRNNRDFDLFIDVIIELKIPTIIVCKEGQVRRELLSENILLLTDIPYKEAMQILANSKFSVIPLKDASTGAGHITIVSAMQLGIPQVITRMPTVSDYFIDGVHGVFVEPNSRDSLKSAVKYLWNDPDKLIAISHEARKFSQKWFMESSSKKHLALYLASIKHGSPLPSKPPHWEMTS